MAEVHYLSGHAEANRLLPLAREVAPEDTRFFEHQEIKKAPPALAEAPSPTSFAVLFSNGREFTGPAGVEALRQLATGASVDHVQPAPSRPGLITSLKQAFGLDDENKEIPAPTTAVRKRRRLPRWLRGERFGVGAWIYLRLLAVAYLFSFLSAALQQPALVGEQGLYPLTERFYTEASWPTILSKPTLLWWWPSEPLLVGQAIAGMLVALLLLLNRAPAYCSLLCAGLYLSVIHAGGPFYGFNHDGLMVEAGIIGALLAPWTLGRARATSPPIAALWLAWILLIRVWTIPLYFRLLFSHQWQGLETYGPRLLTDALPTPMAWFLGHLPSFFLELIAALEITIIIFAPLLFFIGRNFRRIGAAVFLVGLLWLFATNNNSPALLISFGLVLLAIDDRFWWGLRRRHPGFPLPFVGRPSHPALPRQVMTAGLCALLFLSAQMSLAHIYSRFKPHPIRPLVAQAVKPWRIANVYAHGQLFIQDYRNDFVLEGSRDGQTWKPYVFRYRIGPLDRRPPVLGLYEPRLDASPWLPTEERPQPPPWTRPLIRELLHGNPVMDAFFAGNPFPDEPPRFIRIRKYHYHFASLAEWQHDGQWWQREAWIEKDTDKPQPPMSYELNDSGRMIGRRVFD